MKRFWTNARSIREAPIATVANVSIERVPYLSNIRPITIPAGAPIIVATEIAPENNVLFQPNSSVIGPTRTLNEGVAKVPLKKVTIHIDPITVQP